VVAVTILILIPFLLAVAFFFGYMVRETSEASEPAEPVDPEQAMKAAIELHRIRRNLDAAWTKSEQRREGAAVRREIAEAFEEEDG
jgi:hypothetical protein